MSFSSETKRPPLNGCELHMALPVFRQDSIVEYVVMAKTESDYVVSVVPTLDSPSWGQGYYFPGHGSVSLENATRFAYVRAGAHLMPWDEIAAEVKDRPGHY